ncbi:hypothetical protein HID58_048641, partial [Brassica napus]
KRMTSINFKFFDIIGELILMKEESKEDEEHVRGLLENLIKCLDENKIVLDDCIETNNKLIEAIEACLREEGSCGKKNKLIDAMEACSLEDCSSSSMEKS